MSAPAKALMRGGLATAIKAAGYRPSGARPNLFAASLDSAAERLAGVTGHVPLDVPSLLNCAGSASCRAGGSFGRKSKTRSGDALRV